MLTHSRSGFDRCVVEHVAQRRARQEFLNDVVRAAVDTDVVDGRDVGMTQRGRRAGFLLEAREPLGIRGKCWRQDLDGDVAAEPRVAGAIDLAHATFAKLGKDLIGAKNLTNH